VLEDQARGSGVRKGSKNQMPESAKTLKGDDLGFGSLLFLGKEAPSPRFKINLFMDYNISTGKINQTNQKKRTLNKLNNLLQGRDVNTDLIEAELVNDDEFE
jgi:hypothetical protein